VRPAPRDWVVLLDLCTFSATRAPAISQTRVPVLRESIGVGASRELDTWRLQHRDEGGDHRPRFTR
jgi:hypothetical protein